MALDYAPREWQDLPTVERVTAGDLNRIEQAIDALASGYVPRDEVGSPFGLAQLDSARRLSPAQAPAAVPVHSKTASFTFSSEHAGAVVKGVASSDIQATIPAEIAVPLPEGSWFRVEQTDGGRIEIVADAGVTLYPTGQVFRTQARGTGLIAWKLGTNAWHVAAVSDTTALPAHATSHGVGGTDPLSPASIGAPSLSALGRLQTAQAPVGIPLVSQGGNYTPVVADGGKTIGFTGPATVTIPTNTAQPHEIGTVLQFLDMGARVTVVAAGGVTLHPAGTSFVTVERGSVINAYKTGTNEWHVYGDYATDELPRLYRGLKRYYGPPVAVSGSVHANLRDGGSQSGTQAFAAGTLYYFPDTMPHIASISRVACEITVAGAGSWSLGLHRLDRATGLPAANGLVGSFGVVSVAATGVVPTTALGTPVPVGYGDYAWVLLCEVGATARNIAGNALSQLTFASLTDTTWNARRCWSVARAWNGGVLPASPPAGLAEVSTTLLALKYQVA